MRHPPTSHTARLALLVAFIFVCPNCWSQSCKTVKSEFGDDAIFLETQVNDGNKYWLAVDSDSNVTILSSAFWNELKDIALMKREVPFFSFSGVVLNPNPHTIVPQDLGSVRGTTHHQLDGLLGDELFRNFVVQIDYEKKKVVLCSQGALPSGPLGRKVIIQSRDWPLLAVVRAQLESSNKKTFYGELELDTGGTYTVALFSPFISQHPEVHTPGEVSFSMEGLYGPTSMTRSSLAEVHIGDILIRNPPVNLVGPRKQDSSEEADGALGTVFFREFTVTFDYGHNCIFLIRNKPHLERSH